MQNSNENCSSKECCICFETGNLVKSCKNNHMLHTFCIMKLVEHNSRATCPLCREELLLLNSNIKRLRVNLGSVRVREREQTNFINLLGNNIERQTNINFNNIRNERTSININLSEDMLRLDNINLSADMIRL